MNSRTRWPHCAISCRSTTNRSASSAVRSAVPWRWRCGPGSRLRSRRVALVNPAVRVRSAIEVIEALLGQTYPWTADSRKTADDLDFVARVEDFTTQPPLLLVSGELDHPAFQTDAADLVHALRDRYAHPDDVELITVPGLAHPLADEPGLEPAPQLPAAMLVDEIVTKNDRQLMVT